MNVRKLKKIYILGEKKDRKTASLLEKLSLYKNYKSYISFSRGDILHSWRGNKKKLYI